MGISFDLHVKHWTDGQSEISTWRWCYMKSQRAIKYSSSGDHESLNQIWYQDDVEIFHRKRENSDQLVLLGAKIRWLPKSLGLIWGSPCISGFSEKPSNRFWDVSVNPQSKALFTGLISGFSESCSSGCRQLQGCLKVKFRMFSKDNQHFIFGFMVAFWFNTDSWSDSCGF